MSETKDNHTIHVLLVEDSETHAAMIRDALVSLPRQVHLKIAHNLEEARTHLAESVPDLAIVDFLLPDGKGLELLPGNHGEFACPAIIITGHGDEQVAVEALKAGALDYVVKSPEALASLPHVIERALREWGHIVERKRVEEALRKERDFNRTLIQSSAAFFVAIGADGKTIMMNETMLRALGYTADEVVGTDSLTKFVPEGSRQMMAGIFETLVKQGTPTLNENRVLTKDGRELLVEWHGRPVFKATGEFDYFFGLGIDITARKEAEETLQAAHRQLQDVIDFLPDATFVIDRDKKVVAWNRAIEKMTGVPKEEMIGQGDYAYAMPFYGERCPILLDLIESPDLEERAKYDVIGKHGEFVEQYLPFVYGGKGAYVWATASRLFDRDGNFVGAIESIRDISDRKEARDKLETANRELEAFVYTVSHDLRTPLTPIIGYADFLHESCRDQLDELELNCLSEISGSGKRMVALMEDLLTLAEVGQVERPAEPVATGVVVNEVVCGLADQIIQAEVSVDVGDLPTLRVPRTLLVQVFDNLIANAIRYGCKPGDVIEVRGKRNGEKVRLCVSDYGPGVPAEERNRIFEVFYRGTTGKDKKGTGIGLATIQKIARLFDGRAWVEETPGGGSTFCVEMVDIQISGDELRAPVSGHAMK